VIAHEDKVRDDSDACVITKLALASIRQGGRPHQSGDATYIAHQITPLYCEKRRELRSKTSLRIHKDAFFVFDSIRCINLGIEEAVSRHCMAEVPTPQLASADREPCLCSPRTSPYPA
jgi:hypothetical protein